MIVRRRAGSAIILFAAFALIGLARPAAAANPSPGALLIAKEICEAKGVKTMFEPLVRGVIEKARAVFMQTNFMWANDIAAVTAIAHQKYDQRVSELVDATARIYATHFTEAELKNILAFYQSPLGHKMLSEEPKIIDESMVNAGKWGDDLSEEVMATMRAEMKKRGHDM